MGAMYNCLYPSRCHFERCHWRAFHLTRERYRHVLHGSCNFFAYIIHSSFQTSSSYRTTQPKWVSGPATSRRILADCRTGHNDYCMGPGVKCMSVGTKWEPCPLYLFNTDLALRGSCCLGASYSILMLDMHNSYQDMYEWVSDLLLLLHFFSR